MSRITEKHFGANIVMTHDSAKPDSPFLRMLDDLHFTEFRYPGGSVTENATWENGGLARMFGRPMDKADPDYVMTIREALALCADQGVPMNLVIPTKQFWDHATDTFDHAGFDRYLAELGKALAEFPQVKVPTFEVGNEFWGGVNDDKSLALTPAEYGKVANAQIPKLVAFNAKMARLSGDAWEGAGIGVQAGAAWRKEHAEESAEIIAEISMGNRTHVTKVFNHHYPNITRDHMQWQADWTIGSMKVFEDAAGFPDDLELIISEFNTHGTKVANAPKPNQFGNRLAGEWIEELARMVDDGVDTVHHWGLQYKWLRNKMYDKEEYPTGHPRWTEDAGIRITPTPIGTVYDLAQQHLIGKETMTDAAAMAGMTVPDGVRVTGFEGESQRVVFLRNPNPDARDVVFGAAHAGKHVTAYVLTPADNPETRGWDESTQTSEEDLLANSRADVTVMSGTDIKKVALPPEAVLVVTITDPGVGVDIHGVDHHTDTRTDATDDMIVGGTGKDILYGGVGDDEIRGGAGKDLLIGGSGDDTLNGQGGADVLVSEEGADRLAANGEDLVLVGGNAGRVSVALTNGGNTVLTSGAREMRITGFAESDRLGLNGAFQDAEALNAATAVEGKDLRITTPAGAEIVLVGYAAQADALAEQVFDFYPRPEARDLLTKHLTGLREEQAEMTVEHGEGLGKLVGAGDAWPDLDRVPLYATDAHGVETKTGPWPADPEPPAKPDPDTEPDDGDEETPQDPDSGGGGGCFVATAAYGHRREPDVVALRRFRDAHLVNWKAGRAFVRAYWVVGPRMAARVRPDAWSGRAVRAALRPVVAGLRLAGLTQGR